MKLLILLKKIDTYDISIRPYEDCCTVFVPEHPATNPSLEKCIEFEQNFDFESLVQKCIDNTEIITVRAGEIIELEENTACALNDLF